MIITSWHLRKKKKVTWHSQNSEIARVDQQGEIEAKKSEKLLSLPRH